jgi:hypothetical protein
MEQFLRNDSGMDEPPPRYGYAAGERVQELLGVYYDGWMQDWPLEVSDASRLAEFCDAYEHLDLSRIEKFALMQLILFSLDDSQEIDDWLAGEPAPLVSRIRALLRRNFVLHLHTVEYWRMPEETDPENVFKVTHLLREVWDENYRPEYDRWRRSASTN